MANLDSPQWRRAQQTSLWKRTLGSDDEDVKPLRDSFLDARENAAFLLDKIRVDFPNLTVHDITHVDSLWNIADVIIGRNYPINPLEGYILGIAFLIHDAALSYAAVGSIDKLRNTVEWKDAYADDPSEKDEEEFKKECDFVAIRVLHARYAEDIPTQIYKKDNGTTFYIIENDDYRTYLGKLIGSIAASHHWDIDDVKLELETQINPIAEVPGEWDINAQKLACILRCADAGHIDNGRAPFTIYRSLNINGVSQHHWESQIRLGQVRPDKKDSSKLLITSTIPFKKDEFAAWNVAYDAIRLFDEELKKSNLLLNSIDESLVFPYMGVSGANSKEELARYVKTDDSWQPCDVGVHASNIKDLINNLGGNKLYGEDNKLLIALRELIQNARDAIHARINLDPSFKGGIISIRQIEECGDCCLEVIDDGIGMSMDCIKNYLLDFGRSYWKSSSSKKENPGLRSSSFDSVGKFGIGFYSVFMVARSVDVYTKRYDRAVDEAKRVEFPEGLTLSPIISSSTLNAGISTIVKFKLKREACNTSVKIDTNRFVSLQNALKVLTAGLDVDVYYNEQCVHTNILSPSFNKKEWFQGLCIGIENIDTSNADNFAESIFEQIDEIRDNNKKLRGFVGIINPKDYMLFILGATFDFPSIETIRGLWSLTQYNSKERGFIGYLDYNEKSISRNDIYIDQPLKTALNDWFKRKYFENYSQLLNSHGLAESYARFVNYMKLDVSSLVKHNAKQFYLRYLDNSDLRGNSLDQLKTINLHLYCGLHHSSELFSVLEYRHIDINSMPETTYSELIKKFVKIMQNKIFTYGHWGTASIWLNIKLHKKYNQFIYWKSVNRNEFGRILLNEKEDECVKKMNDFLKKYLVDSNKLIHEKFDEIDDLLTFEY